MTHFTFHHTVEFGEKTLQALHGLHGKLDHIICQGEKIMAANEQVLAFLEQLNTYTNQLAEAQQVEATKTAEIAMDIDTLLASAGADLSPEVQAKLQEASDAIKASADFQTAQAQTLTAIAAKNDTPLPPPVEP